MNVLYLELHFEFKAFRELCFLSYYNEYNKLISEVHPSGYKIPKDATKTKFTNKYGRVSTKYEWVDSLGRQYSLEKLWIPRRYEVTRLGQEIFINFREVPNQPFNIDDPYGSFELSYKGRIMSSVNTESISLVGRALPGQFQYNLVEHLKTEELKKYEGYIKNIDVDQIPDYLTLDEEGQPLAEDKLAVWRYFRKTFGDSYTSGSANSSGLPNPNQTRAVTAEVAGSVVEMLNLQQLLQHIDKEIGMAMGIPLQAEGQVSPNSNASDNARSLQQGYTMIESYNVEFNNLWKCVVEEYLNQFINYYKAFFRDNPNIEEHLLNYIVPGHGKKVVKVLRKYMTLGNIGLFLQSDQSDEEYRKLIMTYALQPLAQNAGQGAEIVSTLIKAITAGESKERVHQMLQLAAHDQSKREQESMQLQQQQASRIAAEKKLENDTQRQHELDKIILENSLKQDADEIPAELEVTKVLADMENKRRELDIKQQEANSKEIQQTDNNV
jgi:hypothetical protein